MEEQSFEARDTGGFFSYVFYKDGIARFPSLFGIYLGIWFAGTFVLFLVTAVVGYLTGFVVFPSSGPTLLGSIVFVLQWTLPLIPVAFWESRRRRRGGTQPVGKALASGFARLIPWNDVVRVELRPVRFNTRRWTITVITTSKTYTGRLSQMGTMQEFLRQMVGDRLQVYQQSGVHIRPAN